MVHGDQIQSQANLEQARLMESNSLTVRQSLYLSLNFGRDLLERSPRCTSQAGQAFCDPSVKQSQKT